MYIYILHIRREKSKNIRKDEESDSGGYSLPVGRLDILRWNDERLQRSNGHHGWDQVSHHTFRRVGYQFENTWTQRDPFKRISGTSCE